jgi:minor head structural component GP7
MKFDNEKLLKYLAQVRRIEEHRKRNAGKVINKMYNTMLKQLTRFISDYYADYSDKDGNLSVAILQENSKYAYFLNEIARNISSITPDISNKIQQTVEDTYKASYEGMLQSVNNSSDAELARQFKDLSIKPEIIKQAVNNPVVGLTLPERLERNRREVIYDIKQTIGIGLMNGQRYDTIAKSIKDRLGVSQGKANNIVRTESHRVSEAGLMDSAVDINNSAKKVGLIYASIWHNMGDGKVRPQTRIRTSKGWKTYTSKTKANHIKMEGQTIEVGDLFDLGYGVKATAPGNSGSAANDCHCRCFLEYKMMTFEEFAKATGESIDDVKDEDATVNVEINFKTDKRNDYEVYENSKNQFTSSKESSIIKSNKSLSKPNENINYKHIKAKTINEKKVVSNEPIGSKLWEKEKHERLLQHEKIIGGNNYETALIYDKNGDLIFKKKGARGEVSFTKKEIGKMEGSVITHNHPNNSCFSAEDIDMLRQSKASEIRARTKFGTYVINPPKSWEKDITGFKQINQTYNDFIDKAIIDSKDKAAREGKPLFAYLREAEVEGAKNFFDKYGFAFRIEGE